MRWTRKLDRRADLALRATAPALRRAERALAGALARGWKRSAPVLLPAYRGARRGLGWCFRGLALAEAGIRRGAGAAARGATAASRVLTPRRALAAVMVAGGAALIVAQFIDYRGVEIGISGYKGLEDLAKPPAVDIPRAGEAHSYLLVAPGAAAIVLGCLCGLRESGRAALAVAGLGLISLAVILLVDLPAGLDLGTESNRFADASAVLRQGFYGELAAAGTMLISGLLYIARPCRTRTNSSGRAASARRRRPRRRASSRARVARSA